MDYKKSYEELMNENTALKSEIAALKVRLGVAITPQPTEQTVINKRSTPKEKIELFMSLFRGRQDVYAKRWYSRKTKRSGYSPVCLNEWEIGICDKKRYTCKSCPNRKLATMNESVIEQHLRGNNIVGGDVIGIYPLTEDESVYFLAVDFDGEQWEKDIITFHDACKENQISVAIERSRSGNGGHAWIFFEDKVPASTARKLGSGLLTYAMDRHHELNFTSYDRLFPNQDLMPKGGFGNLIALPLQGQARKENNSVFIDENFAPYDDQWFFLSNIKKLSLATVESTIKKLCKYGDIGILAKNNSDAESWENKSTIPLSVADFGDSIQIVRANMLHIKKQGLPQSVLNQMKRLGAFKNPDFYKSQAMRLPTYNKPRIIDTTEENELYLSIPRGCEDQLQTLIGEQTNIVIEDKTNSGQKINVDFIGELREEQQVAFEALSNHNIGVLSATTAFGKTVIGAKMIAEKKVNTLILVHTSALLSQWQEALLKFLSIHEELPKEPRKRGRKKKRSIIGQLGAGKNTLNGMVDVAIMQSLSSGDEVKELVKDYGMVIIDECHHVSAFSFERILKTITAKHVYGLTATPTRQDGQHPIIFMHCGAIRYTVDAKKQAEKRHFEHYIIPRFTSFKKPISINDADFGIHAVYTALCESVNRNKMIVNDVCKEVQKGRRPIVLTQRSAHAKVLVELLQKQLETKIILLTGGGTTKEKREKLLELATIPVDQAFVIVATGKYVGEGFDEPRLDTLFLAMPIAWKGTLAQYAGRLHRPFEGKTEVIVYDYVDPHIKMLSSMYLKRVKGYAAIGYKTRMPAITSNATGIIYDSQNYFQELMNDLLAAKDEVVIVSPYMKKRKAMQILNTLSTAQNNGVKITVVTKSADDYKAAGQATITSLISEMKSRDYRVVDRANVYQRFVIVDNKLVWYGSVNLLAFGGTEESMLRLLNPEIAEELLSTLE